jgi:hypothetical protein
MGETPAMASPIIVADFNFRVHDTAVCIEYGGRAKSMLEGHGAFDRVSWKPKKTPREERVLRGE